MPQVSIGKYGTCGMCRHNNIVHRTIIGEHGEKKMWEVYDWGQCKISGKSIMYRDTCESYSTIDNADQAYYIK